MINVLQDWDEIGTATKFLGKENLPKHQSPEKNWDFYQLCRLVEPMGPQTRIIDLGCGHAFTLGLLSAMGFENVYGIDLSISCIARLKQLRSMWSNKSLRVPFHLRKSDITRTGYADDFFDVAGCISVIEHGLDLDKFLTESCRILKPGGLLFITTDYWAEEITIDPEFRAFGLSWKIFSKTDILRFIDQASDCGFVLYEDSTIPPCSQKCAAWNGREYTFISMVLKKG